MIFGTVAILGCAGYFVYMGLNRDRKKYYLATTEDGTVVTKKKTSKWSE